MSDENLGESLTESYRAHKRTVAVRNLGERTHLTLEKLAKLVSHEEHGDIVKDITLQELIDVSAPKVAVEEEEDDERAPAPKAKKKAAKKTTAPKKAAKKQTKPAAKKTAKKAAKKPAAKKNADGRKADFGKKKPRLDYATGMKEVYAALKAHGEPAGRSDIEEATGYSGVQVRTFCKKLVEDGKIKILGKGGRSTRYALP